MAYEDTDEQFSKNIRETDTISIAEAWLYAAHKLHKRKMGVSMTSDDFLSIKHQVVAGFSLVSNKTAWPKEEDVLARVNDDDKNTNDSVRKTLSVIKPLFKNPSLCPSRRDVIKVIDKSVDELQPAA
jgi:hypothetical protein